MSHRPIRRSRVAARYASSYRRLPSSRHRPLSHRCPLSSPSPSLPPSVLRIAWPHSGASGHFHAWRRPSHATRRAVCAPPPALEAADGPMGYPCARKADAVREDTQGGCSEGARVEAPTRRAWTRLRWEGGAALTSRSRGSRHPGHTRRCRLRSRPRRSRGDSSKDGTPSGEA